MFQSRTTRQGKWLVTCAGNVSSILVHDLIPCVFQAEQLSLGFGEHKILTFDLCRLGMWYVCVQTLCGMYVSKRCVVCMCPNAMWYVCVQSLCGMYVVQTLAHLWSDKGYGVSFTCNMSCSMQFDL